MMDIYQQYIKVGENCNPPQGGFRGGSGGKKTAIEVAFAKPWMAEDEGILWRYNNISSRAFAIAWVLLVTLSLP